MLLEAEREQLAEWGRRLAPLTPGTSGNLSLKAGDRICVSPSGIPYEEVSAALVCVVDESGRLVEGDARPTTELALHLEAYRATGCSAVVHTHSDYATALACANEELPAVHYLVASLGGPVRVAPYALPGSAGLATNMADALRGRRAVLLGNHGALVTGSSLPSAVHRAELLEWLCGLWWRTRALGAAKLLGESELDDVREALSDYGPLAD